MLKWNLNHLETSTSLISIMNITPMFTQDAKVNIVNILSLLLLSILIMWDILEPRFDPGYFSVEIKNILRLSTSPIREEPRNPAENYSSLSTLTSVGLE